MSRKWEDILIKTPPSLAPAPASAPAPAPAPSPSPAPAPPYIGLNLEHEFFKGHFSGYVCLTSFEGNRGDPEVSMNKLSPTTNWQQNRLEN